MRVLILSEWYPSASEPIAGAFVRDQALAAARLHDVTVLVHAARVRRVGEPAILRHGDMGLETLTVRTWARRGTKRGRIEFLVAAARAMALMRERGQSPQLIHAHVFSAGLAGLLLARGRCPVVISEHHSDFIEERISGLDATAAHTAFRRANTVCPVSSTLMESLRRFEPEARYEVVPNVVDVEPFLAAGERRVSRQPSRFLVVARLSREKGIDHLLTAAGELARSRRDFRLDIVGDGPERMRLEALARSTLPGGIVAFHGERTREEVSSTMSRSDVFVLPSIVETFGVAVVEAIAAGLPVLTTTAVPNHQLIADRFGIAVPSGSAGALSVALAELLDRPRKVPRVAAVEFVRSFGAPVLAQRWTEVYAAASSSRPGVSRLVWTR
jgi:glycosyltransferase involved in cell wall biosynthesis